MATEYGYGKIATSGLYFYYDAANPACYPGSGATVFDLSGNNYNGTLTNGASYNTAGYFSFNGSSQYIQQTFVATTGTTEVTMETWAYVNTLPGLNTLIYTNGNSGWRGRIDSTSSWWQQGGNSGAYNAVFGSGSLSTNTWYHIVGTIKNGDYRIYLDGVLSNTNTGPFNPSGTAASEAGVGGAPVFGDYMNGRIAVAKLYKRFLSADEVLQNYNAQKSRFKK